MNRKLKLQVQITVDGYVGTETGDQDWRTWDWDDKLKAFTNNLLDSCDTILLGRKFAEIFIPHFESETFEYAKTMVRTHKIVFSKKIKAFDGKNVSVENRDFVSAIKELKRKEGKDILVHGGASFVSSLIKEGLIDEFNFFVNSVMINKGMRIFDLLDKRQKLKLVNAIPFECGVSVLTYNLGNTGLRQTNF